MAYVAQTMAGMTGGPSGVQEDQGGVQEWHVVSTHTHSSLIAPGNLTVPQNTTASKQSPTAHSLHKLTHSLISDRTWEPDSAPKHNCVKAVPNRTLAAQTHTLTHL